LRCIIGIVGSMEDISSRKTDNYLAWGAFGIDDKQSGFSLLR
jgi:hypothetical protein